jgi:hypothetical protein
VVVERGPAVKQLCAPVAGAPVFAIPLAAPGVPFGIVPPPSVAPRAADAAGAGDVPGEVCDEGERYRCASGAVIECASGQAVARCVRGCFYEGTGVDDDDVSREAAFAILCSR